MAQTTDKVDLEMEEAGEEIRPIRFVQRELTRPDGTTVTVDVPVYPPFELKSNPGAARKPPAPRARSRLKTRRTG